MLPCLVNKRAVLAISVAVIGIAVAAASFGSSQPGATDSMMEDRTHGTVSTTMGSPILGDPSAPITIIEFGDYQCHFCNKWFHDTKPAIESQYIDTGKANLVFVDLAFLGRDSPTAAQASYCADDQGMYWEYHDILYTYQESQIDGGWANSERLNAFASSIGLDLDQFTDCLDSGKHAQRVQYNTSQAKSHGLTATPGFIIVGSDRQVQISGAQPFSVFQQTLDSLI